MSSAHLSRGHVVVAHDRRERPATRVTRADRSQVHPCAGLVERRHDSNRPRVRGIAVVGDPHDAVLRANLIREAHLRVSGVTAAGAGYEVRAEDVVQNPGYYNGAVV